MSEKVDHPKHYNIGKFEVIDVIEDWKLGFCLGNAVKYIARAEHKENKVEDLKKAVWYLQREIQNCENKVCTSETCNCDDPLWHAAKYGPGCNLE